MANGYKEGYDKGYADGKGGREKQAVANLKQLFSMAVKSQAYENEFYSGYNEGYHDGIKDKNRGS